MDEKNEILLSEHNYGLQILDIIRSDADDNDIKSQLQEFHVNDIAGVFEDLTVEERDRLHKILGTELLSDIVSYLDDAGDYLSEITVASGPLITTVNDLVAVVSYYGLAWLLLINI